MLSDKDVIESSSVASDALLLKKKEIVSDEKKRKNSFNKFTNQQIKEREREETRLEKLV